MKLADDGTKMEVGWRLRALMEFAGASPSTDLPLTAALTAARVVVVVVGEDVDVVDPGSGLLAAAFPHLARMTLMMSPKEKLVDRPETVAALTVRGKP